MKLKALILLVCSSLGLNAFAQVKNIFNEDVSFLEKHETSWVFKKLKSDPAKFPEELISQVNTGGVNANTVSSEFRSIENFCKSLTLPIITSPLQVELLYFRVTCLDKDNQYFEWEMLGEENCNYYEVEESVDGIEWMSLKKFPNNVNNSGNTRKYNFTYYAQRAGVPSLSGYLYRLKQVGFSNELSFSDVVSTNCNSYESDVIDVFPNPTNGTLTVSCYNLDEGIDLKEIRISDMLGSVVDSRKINGDCYVYEECFNIENTMKGVYLVSIITKNKTIVKKIIYQ